MIEYLESSAVLFLSQSIIFAFLLFVLRVHYRTFSRQYALYWQLSFILLAIALLLKALAPVFSSVYINGIISDIATPLLYYLSLLFLLFGLYNTKYKQAPSVQTVVISTIITVMFSLLTTSLFVFDESNIFNHFYLSVSLPNFIFGCSLLLVALLFFVDKTWHFSSKLLMYYALIMGCRHLLYSFISILALTEHWFQNLTQVFVYFDMTAYVVLGFIMLVWMQGAEQFSALSEINKAQYLGKRDSLTGALNREQVLARLTEVIGITKKKKKLAVYLLDIKKFKFINDRYGLKVGDNILGEVANRLNHSVFMPKAVGRLSGDSFMFVIEYEQLSQIKSGAQHLHKLINKPFCYDQQEIQIQISIGYCFYPEHALKAEDLLRKANLALHFAESNHIASVAFEEGVQTEGCYLHLREEELKLALFNENFILYFQPQLNLRSNRLEGVEALVRWQHSTKGLLLPAEFLGDIEKLGLHIEFGRYILEKACQMNAHWFETYGRRITIAVNITAIEFQDIQFVATVKGVLQHYNVPPNYLELEITENVVMTDINQAMNSIVKLQNMGIKVSIDDFGTGYSSLAYLRKLPIDKIKIDRSFIEEVASNDSDLTIVKSMVDLSHGLGKRVLAEGVETKEQLQLLQHLGCDAIQGFYISKPLSEKNLQNYFVRKNTVTN